MKTVKESRIFGFGIGPLIVIAVLTLIIIVLSFVTWKQFDSAKDRGVFERRNKISEGFFHKGKMGDLPKNPVTVTPESIQEWMTFQYLEFSFQLPKDYLKNDLSIEHGKYPKISIMQYARKNDLDLQVFLKEVQNSVRKYQNSNQISDKKEEQAPKQTPIQLPIQAPPSFMHE